MTRTRTPPPVLTDFTHVREDRIRFSDLDFQRHVTNSALTALLADGRYEFLGDHVRVHLAPGARIVLVKLEVEFLREVLYGSPVFTGTRFARLGNTSFTLGQAIFQDGQCAVSGTCVFAHVADGETAASPLPEAIRTNAK